MKNNLREEFSRYIAIDYGSKRIGIAVSDPTENFAIPISTIPNDEKFWINFKSEIDKFKIKAFILGYPLKESSQKTVITEEVEKFAEKLKKKFGKKIILADERYSSLVAEKQIIESVKSKKKRRDKSLIDKMAAAVILQAFLDMQTNFQSQNNF